MSVVTTTSLHNTNVTAVTNQTIISAGNVNISSPTSRIVAVGLKVAAVNMTLEQMDRMRSFKSNAVVTFSSYVGETVTPLLSLIGILEWCAHDVEDGVPQFFYLVFRNTRMRILNLSLTTIYQIQFAIPLPSNCIIPGLESTWVKIASTITSVQVAPRLSNE